MSYPDYYLEDYEARNTEYLSKLLTTNLNEINKLHSKINKLTEENIKLKCDNNELRESLLRECEQCIELMNMIADEQ